MGTTGDDSSDGIVVGKAVWIRSAMAAVPMPGMPATEPWEMSLATFLRLRTDLPELVLKPLGLLDRYGAVGFGPNHVGFDGEDIAWDRVVRIGVRDIAEVVTSSAMDCEAQHIKSLLPPLPGRKWVVDKAMDVITGMAAPILTDVATGVGVASEIAYRTKLGREKTLHSGFFAALLLATRRPIHESLVATARAKGVAISPDVDAPR
jgi:hypothetical protein